MDERRNKRTSLSPPLSCLPFSDSVQTSLSASPAHSGPTLWPPTFRRRTWRRRTQPRHNPRAEPGACTRQTPPPHPRALARGFPVAVASLLVPPSPRQLREGRAQTQGWERAFPGPSDLHRVASGPALTPPGLPASDPHGASPALLASGPPVRQPGREQPVVGKRALSNASLPDSPLGGLGTAAPKERE